MARTFDGTDDNIDIGNLGTFGSADLTNPFSISVDLNTTDTTIECLYGVIQGAGSDTLFQVLTNQTLPAAGDQDKMTIQLRGDGTEGQLLGRFTNDAVFTNGVWHNLVVVVDPNGNTITVYLDGTDVPITLTDTGTPNVFSDFASGFLVGARENRGTPDLFFTGSLAEFAIWTRALTAAEAAILGDGFSPLFIPNSLRNYLPIIGRASPEPELRQSSNGTVTGTTYLAHPRIIYPYGDPKGITRPSLKQIKRINDR